MPGCRRQVRHSLGMEEVPGRIAATWTYCSALSHPHDRTHVRASGNAVCEAWSRHRTRRPESSIARQRGTTRARGRVEWKIAGIRATASCPRRFEYQATRRRTPPPYARRRGAEYAELNRKANRLAHCLVEAVVDRGVVVGVHATRSPRDGGAAGNHGKCRAAYVPFDPNSTSKRWRSMIEDAGIELVWSQSALRAKVPVSGSTSRAGHALAENMVCGIPDQQSRCARQRKVVLTTARTSSTPRAPTGVPKGSRSRTPSLAEYCRLALASLLHAWTRRCCWW